MTFGRRYWHSREGNALIEHTKIHAVAKEAPPECESTRLTPFSLFFHSSQSHKISTPFTQRNAVIWKCILQNKNDRKYSLHLLAPQTKHSLVVLTPWSWNHSSFKEMQSRLIPILKEKEKNHFDWLQIISTESCCSCVMWRGAESPWHYCFWTFQHHTQTHISFSQQHPTLSCTVPCRVVSILLCMIASHTKSFLKKFSHFTCPQRRNPSSSF